MITEIIELAKTQPILVGGVGTVATSSVLYLLRSLPNRVISTISNSLISELSIDNKNEYYNSVNKMISKYKMSWTFRNYEPAESEYDELDDKKSKGDYLIPGYGSGWGYWEGVFFNFFKEREDHGQQVIKKLHIKFYTRNENRIAKFFKQAIFLSVQPNVQKMYLSSRGYWDRGQDKKIRSLDTVYISSEIKERVISKIEYFLKNEDYYLKRGIPYKFCFMLYGIPGTGKTSFIHALAGYFKLDIYYVTSLGNLKGLFTSSKISGPGIVVIEDIDALSEDLNRKKEEDDEDPLTKIMGSSNSNTFHDLLNSLDGFTSQHGLLMAITSNHPDRLDPALVRPGRIDLAIELGPLDADTARDMFFDFYGDEDFSFWEEIEKDYTPLTGSKLQEIFMNNTAAQAAQLLKTTKTQAPQMAANGQS